MLKTFFNFGKSGNRYYIKLKVFYLDLEWKSGKFQIVQGNKEYVQHLLVIIHLKYILSSVGYCLFCTRLPEPPFR